MKCGAAAASYRGRPGWDNGTVPAVVQVLLMDLAARQTHLAAARFLPTIITSNGAERRR
jgi:transposase-like protein